MSPRRELERELRCFEEIVESRLPKSETGRRVASALRELYGTRSASRVMGCFRELCKEDIGTALNASRENDPFVLGSRLPAREVVQDAAPKLMKATELKDWDQAVKSLSQMEIPALCSSPGQMFDRLEFVVGLVIGRARLVPLVELAIFASEMCAYDRARRCVTDARTLAPEPPELHDLYTVDGIISLADDQVEEAKQLLAKSVDVCRADENARVTCSIRPVNLMLAEMLLERGEKGPVLVYLERCRDVWSYEDVHITTWIESIKADRKPDFAAASIRNVLKKPKTRIRDLALRGIFLAERPDERIGADVSEVRTQFKRDVTAALQGKLNLGKN